MCKYDIYFRNYNLTILVSIDMEQGFEFRSVFNAEVVNHLADDIKRNYRAFDSDNFKNDIN